MPSAEWPDNINVNVGSPKINWPVGSPSEDFPMPDVKFVHFHNFATLTRTKGQVVESPEFVCAGQKWKLQLYPGGHESSMYGWVAVFLKCVLPPHFTYGDVLEADFAINIKESDGQNYRSKSLCSPYSHYDQNEYYSFSLDQLEHGDSDYIKFDEVLGLLENSTILSGQTLTFELLISMNTDYYCHIDKPQRISVGDNMLKLFLQEHDKDLAFNVKGKIITVHRAILKAQAPDLAELSETNNLSKPMIIQDVDPGIFALMIGYLYGKNFNHVFWGEQSTYLFDEENQENSILRAAGKYGMNTLRSEAEGWTVKFLILKFDDAIQHLFYADSNNLPLLKKTVMDFIVDNATDVVSCESYSLLSESLDLMQEVMKAMAEQLSNNKRQRLIESME